jgi:hypothetical protein
MRRNYKATFIRRNSQPFGFFTQSALSISYSFPVLNGQRGFSVQLFYEPTPLLKRGVGNVQPLPYLIGIATDRFQVCFFELCLF